MNYIKLILALIGLLVLGFAAWWVIGFLYSAFWTLLFIGGIAAVGVVGYKMYAKKEAPQLESKDPVTQVIFDDAAAQKQLEDLKRKYLTK
jgi:hypothetical protein